jgi:hypothetical protein
VICACDRRLQMEKRFAEMQRACERSHSDLVAWLRGNGAVSIAENLELFLPESSEETGHMMLLEVRREVGPEPGLKSRTTGLIWPISLVTCFHMISD